MTSAQPTVTIHMVASLDGFIAAEDGKEYFFHHSACQGVSFDSLHEGQRVTFDLGQGPKGPRAENVKLA